MTSSLWRIERLVPGGDGLARLADGRVGFAHGAYPGDVIAVQRSEVKGSYVRALTWELAEASAERVVPPCPVASQCGGCSWMGLERSAQVRGKAALVQDALTRIGHFSTGSKHLAVVSAGPELRYRNRLRLQIDTAGRVGLFARATHRVVEIPGCLLAHAAIDTALSVLRDIAASHPGALASFEAVEIRVAQAGPSPLLVLFLRAAKARGKRKHHAPSVGRRGSEQGSQPALSLAAKALLTELAQRYTLEIVGAPRVSDCEQRWTFEDGVQLFVPPTSFVQVNWAVNSALVAALLRGARQRGVRFFCDIYCGAGNFSLPLAKAGLAGVGIERNPDSVRAARRAALAQGLLHVHFLEQSAESLGPSLLGTAPRADLVIVDPPRAGARELLAAIAQLGPAHIAVCSCDPATLARDLRSLGDLGYAIDELTAFDMFPQTHHVETLAWLRRDEAPDGL